MCPENTRIQAINQRWNKELNTWSRRAAQASSAAGRRSRTRSIWYRKAPESYPRDGSRRRALPRAAPPPPRPEPTRRPNLPAPRRPRREPPARGGCQPRAPASRRRRDGGPKTRGGPAGEATGRRLGLRRRPGRRFRSTPRKRGSPWPAKIVRPKQFWKIGVRYSSSAAGNCTAAGRRAARADCHRRRRLEGFGEEKHATSAPGREVKWVKRARLPDPFMND